MEESSSDVAAIQLAAQLQLEELDDAARRDKGKQREGETSDFMMAVDLYRYEMASLASPTTSLDRIAEARRRLAVGGSESGSSPTDLFDNLASKFRDLSLQGKGYDGPGSAAESSRQGMAGAGPSTRAECISCTDGYLSTEMAKCPCSHHYCRECFDNLIRQASIDETLFPPRCCRQRIPLDDYEDFLPAETVRQFKEKEVEFSTSKRLYCHRPTCSAFVPPEMIEDDVATCSQCGAKTCALCKGAKHLKECPTDELTQNFLEFSKAQGWQRCSSCDRMVELATGCNHISGCSQRPARISRPCADDVWSWCHYELQHAHAAPSSAMFVARCGGRAHALNGTRPAFSAGRRIS